MGSLINISLNEEKLDVIYKSGYLKVIYKLYNGNAEADRRVMPRRS